MMHELRAGLACWSGEFDSERLAAVFFSSCCCNVRERVGLMMESVGCAGIEVYTLGRRLFALWSVLYYRL